MGEGVERYSGGSVKIKKLTPATPYNFSRGGGQVF